MITITSRELLNNCPSLVLDKLKQYESDTRETQVDNHDVLSSPSVPSLSLNQLIHSTLTTAVQSPQQQQPVPPQGSISINISDMILDVENLPQMFQDEQTTTSYDSNKEMDLVGDDEVDPKVEEYLRFKRDHQLKFLKEVKMKGLVLKGSSGKGGGGVDQTQTNKFMNY